MGNLCNRYIKHTHIEDFGPTHTILVTINVVIHKQITSNPWQKQSVSNASKGNLKR